MKLGDFIMQYREEHELSQRQFAMKCGLSNGYIAMLEKGKNPKTNKPITPTLEKLGMIAKGMGMDVHDLMRSVDGDTQVILSDEADDEIETIRHQIIHIVQIVPKPILQPLYELIQALLADAQKFDESVRQLNQPKS